MPWVSTSAVAALLSSVLAIAPASEPGSGTLDLAAPGLDASAVELGLRARLGDELEAWSIDVEALGGPRYRVDLRAPDGASSTRELSLAATTDEDRSRELASTLALIIESSTSSPDSPDSDSPVPDSPTPESPARAPQPTRPAPSPELPVEQRPSGLLAIEAHTALGPPRAIDPAFGLGLVGGAVLLRDHLQPRVGVRWAHGSSGTLRVDQVSARVGLAAGSPVGRWWLGALVMPSAQWTRAEQQRVASGWSFGGELSLLGQVRIGPAFIGLRTGIESNFPAPTAIGAGERVRWGHLRGLVALEVGLRM